jgi:hypothetical protein
MPAPLEGLEGLLPLRVPLAGRGASRSSAGWTVAVHPVWGEHGDGGSGHGRRHRHCGGRGLSWGLSRGLALGLLPFIFTGNRCANLFDGDAHIVALVAVGRSGLRRRRHLQGSLQRVKGCALELVVGAFQLPTGNEGEAGHGTRGGSEQSRGPHCGGRCAYLLKSKNLLLGNFVLVLQLEHALPVGDGFLEMLQLRVGRSAPGEGLQDPGRIWGRTVAGSVPGMRRTLR